jgi:hypothetical protein
VTLENRAAAREHRRVRRWACEVREGVVGSRMGPLFWILLIFAAGFARYFVLAVRDGDGQLAVAAATAFVLVSTLAAAELLGWLW